MNLNNPFPYNPTFKQHFLIAAVLGILLSFILIALQPFNLSIASREHKALLLVGFGFLKFISYLTSHFIANDLYRKLNTWTVWNEIVFLLLSSLMGMIFSYIYLDLVFEKHPLSFNRLALFFYYIGLPLFPLVVFPKVVLRYLLIKDSTLNSEEKTLIIKEQQEKLTLKGQNNNEELTLFKEDLLYVKSLDNYVVVNYKNKNIESKILRARLGDILSQAPFLIQPHRSYLINPEHSFKLQGNSQKATLTLTSIEETIPISRASYKTVKPLFN
ncbi:LytTr DNA-binding domain-containing protein [Tenacibaculum sp. MAR_2009_124]|uniref:LytTR family DNA-binding domain-containing protein n=1 Tax=Tenacibaculum sp. MAR_2009_124 TaxID=1250059 RepID=UPI00089D7CF5|nr:LytTR family DNA-binding domain-containing protein [Tenacibaculum sp. MAR_2009_124]SEB84077.1 LytTr DNA-binding domain-containing protein [Tenacibaculum sp. MAR_2009_124]